MKRHLWLLPMTLSILLAACGGPPPTQLERLYQELSDPLPRVDPSILRGRRILVDPGHGGQFRGTVGQDSLEETHVNLGVSLYLWGLLREAGAEVYLTRSADRDFLTAADSSLAGDLQARVDLADSLTPDVFISIHHNAQPQRNPEYNRVETYYKAGDPASQDLGSSIHRHLMRNLGINVGAVRQGNYYVLRNVDIPAVLGESSYLTHPPAEDALQLSRAQRLEAEAYFLGLLDYFQRGIPRIETITPRDSIFDEVPLIAVAMADDGGTGIDADGVVVTVNGERVAPFISSAGDRLDYRLPWDTPNGPYAIDVSARNLRGNTSSTHPIRFVIDMPPEVALFEPLPRRVSDAGGIVQLRARLLDRRGVAIADSTPVEIHAGDVNLTANVRDAGIAVALPVASGSQPLVITATCRGKSFQTTLERTRDQAPTRSVTLIDARTGQPVAGAAVQTDDSLMQMSSATALYSLATGTSVLRAPGYQPVVVDAAVVADTVDLVPWFGGVLVGRRFVLDPEGGTAAGAGQFGLGAAEVNLRTASYLASYLNGAGADVLMTRTNEEVRSPEDIARMTNRYGADRYIDIRHPATTSDAERAARAYFFPGSRMGSAMAESVGGVLSRRLGTLPQPATDRVTYPLQQTACPAIIVEAPPITIVAEEQRLDDASYVREQAYALFLGILEHYQCTDSLTLDVTVDDQDSAGWLVTVDDTWSLVTDADGRAIFEYLPAGPHEVRARRASRTAEPQVSTGAESVMLTPKP